MTVAHWRWMGLRAVGFALAACLAAQATRGNGKVLFERRCGGCHALNRDLEGPRLGRVYGRTAGSVRSFEYSDALKNSRIIWDSRTLDEWLTDPEGLVPGNNMAFHLEKAVERQDVIDYLKSTAGW